MRSDVSVAKNFLTEDEMYPLNNKNPQMILRHLRTSFPHYEPFA